MGESRNRVGGAYALTTFAPIIPGHEDELRAHIEGLPTGADSPLARLDTLHLSRIQIFDQLVHQGPKHDLDHLESTTSCSPAASTATSTPTSTRLRADPDRRRQLVEPLRRLSGNRRQGRVQAWIKTHQRHTNLFASAYHGGTVADVRESLALRERLVDFAADAQGLDAAALKERFLSTFAKAGR